MKYSISVSEIAQFDIEDASEYYEIKRQGLSRLFLMSIKDTFKVLATNPFAYVKIYKEFRRALLKKFPYALFYKIDDENKEVIIYRVLCTYREPNTWKQKIVDDME